MLGVLAKDGVVLAAEKTVTGKLLLDLSSAKEGGYGGSGEKIFLLKLVSFFSLKHLIRSYLIFSNFFGMSSEA